MLLLVLSGTGLPARPGIGLRLFVSGAAATAGVTLGLRGVTDCRSLGVRGFLRGVCESGRRQHGQQHRECDSHHCNLQKIVREPMDSFHRQTVARPEDQFLSGNRKPGEVEKRRRSGRGSVRRTTNRRTCATRAVLRCSADAVVVDRSERGRAQDAPLQGVAGLQTDASQPRAMRRKEDIPAAGACAARTRTAARMRFKGQNAKPARNARLFHSN